MKDFLKKNFNLYHIVGIVFFEFIAVFYWYKKGQFSDNFLQNNLFLMIVWGLLVGYIIADLVKNAVNRKE
ncbi:MAG: hypothetical protein MJZ72_03440 [Bacteroidales bacterium]|nr:hypothetical protein [Bacteroidales bacterium]